MHNTVVSTEALKMLHDSDTWVIVCPLYVDGIPAHLLSCLVQLETCDWTDCPIRIHGIVNCGFYEGIQAEFALDILQNWSAKTGLTWGRRHRYRRRGRFGTDAIGGKWTWPQSTHRKSPPCDGRQNPAARGAGEQLRFHCLSKILI